MTADICVLMNLGSGKRKGVEKARELEALFERHPGRFTLRVLRSGKQIAPEAAKAVREGFSTVVAAGGDGTICAVASSLVGSEARLGILPLGTFNYFARSLGLPEAIKEAVDVLARGESRPIDTGEVNGRVFLNNASLGAYPAILQSREQIYRRWGRSRIAAYWSVLATLANFHSPLTLSITIDGAVRRFRSPLVFVSNNAYQLDLLGLEGAECIKSGRFALFVTADSGRRDLLRHALRLATRTIANRRDFELVCGDDIVLETAKPQRLVALDGERERMRGPFHFRMRRQALNVVVPAGSAEE